jgi:hypothetical protein
MARERKPLIEPGLLQPPDVFSRILANDRLKRNGGPEAEETTSSPEDNVTNESSNYETLQRYNVTTNDISLQSVDTAGDVIEELPIDSLQKTAPAKAAEPVPVARTERLAKALELASEDEIAVVTVRVSAKLNDYMDRYVERINRITPKRRYRKQDAIAEAFAAFFADHPLPPAPEEEEI